MATAERQKQGTGMFRGWFGALSESSKKKQMPAATGQSNATDRHRGRELDISRAKAHAIADPVARKAPDFLSLPSVTNLQPLVFESLTMTDGASTSPADAPIKPLEVAEGSKALELPSDIAESLFSSDFWAEPKLEPMPPKPAETSSVLSSYSLPSSQVSSASKRNTFDGSQKRVSNHLSSVELARSWHKAKNAATDARTSDAIDGTVKRLSQSRDVQESRSLPSMAATSATYSPEPNQSTVSIRSQSALSRASKTSSHRSYKPHMDDHSDTSSEEEESEHGSSSEDERPLSQLARPHTSSNENAPLAQLRLHSLNNKSSPMILSTRMHSPPPLVATTTFISGYSHSESSNSDTTLVAQSPKSNPAQPKDFKSFMSTIFTNKNQGTGDLGRRSQSSLGFRSSSPALTSSPTAERPMSPTITRNVNSFPSPPLGNVSNQNSPLQHPEAHDTFPTTRWSMSNNGPQQPTYLAPHPAQFQMMQPSSNWAGVNEAYNPHLAGRMWSDSDNGGSDYGANPHVWTQHELRAAATRSEYGGSQHSSSSFHRPAPAPMQPLVQIPGVTSMGSVLPVSRPTSPSSNRAMSPTPMGAMSMLPPPMANANSADSNQLLKYMMYHRDMANKAYEAYQSSVTAESVDGRQSAPLITIGPNGQSLPLELAHNSANLIISTSRSSSSLKHSSPLSPSSAPSKSKSRSSKGKKSSSKSKGQLPDSAGNGAKSEFDELYELAGAINSVAAAAADGYLSPPLTRRSATAQPGLQRESSGTSLSTSSTGRPVGILRSVSGGGAIEGGGVARVKKGVKFDETAAAGDNERGPMTKRRKNKSLVKVLDS
ncbi:hypothetical protein HDU80_001950 [Chytriomyces hyalinus]|nr:hypothetical protein HDU80_001950 [Chytriomyces hyalinus]